MGALIPLLASTALGAGPGEVRFPEQLLVDGTSIPAHASVSGEPSDAAAAGRWNQLARSPYTRFSEERLLLDGSVVLALDDDVPFETASTVQVGLASAAARLFDRDGWERPFSPRDPLRLELTAGPADLGAVAAWEGRENGRLLAPVVAVPSLGRTPGAVLLDAVRQVALLSLRQTAPEEASWCVEALAESLARKALGYAAHPVPGSDPLLARTGTLTEPLSAAEYLGFVQARPGLGPDGLRAAWEEAGASRGDDAEAFLRQVSARADPRGLAGLLADLLAARVTAATAATSRNGTDRVGSVDVTGGAPPPLGWRRLSFRTAEERGGLEISLPDHGAVGSARAVVLYRGADGTYDVTALTAGGTRMVPLSGTAELDIVLADGAEASRDFYVRLRRAPGYPAALTSASAEWRDGAARVSWRTASHRDLLAWVVARYEETPGGELVERGREIVPTAEAADAGFDYEFSDPAAVAGERLRYRVFALTRDGLLSEAFETVLAPGR